MENNWGAYRSPYSWRYGSREMRQTFSEEHHRRGWRNFWVALAKTQNKYGIVSDEEFFDIAIHTDGIDIEEDLKIERKIHHDVTAAVRSFAARCPIGGGKIHLGATSNDAVDNAWPIQIRDALGLIKNRVISLLVAFRNKIDEHKNLVCVGWTHLQPAEPTTVGYRLAQHAQNLLVNVSLIQNTEDWIRVKGPKGAVGTAASYVQLLGGNVAEFFEFEKAITDELGARAWTVTTQTYPRIMDSLVVSTLSILAQTLHKFSLDFRFLAQGFVGEVQEPVLPDQVDSSTMAFKRNQHKSERVASLTRVLLAAENLAWMTGASTLLERTMDDSAARRAWLPEAFLALDQALIDTEYVLKGMTVRPKRIKRNLERFGEFMVLESFMTELVNRYGLNRQEIHEFIRAVSLPVWETAMDGENTSLREPLVSKIAERFTLPENEVRVLFDALYEKFLSPVGYTGIAAAGCEKLCAQIDTIVLPYQQGRQEPQTPEF